MAEIEKRYLPPLNPGTTLTETDRSRVYDIVRRQLADVLSGEQSYYPDSTQKNMQERTEDLEHFIASMESLRGLVNDPSDVLGGVVGDLKSFSEKFKDRNAANEPLDPIEIPRQLAPNTRDRNDRYVNPSPGPYSPPNQVAPWQQPMFRGASLQSPPRPTTSPTEDALRDFYRNDPAWLLQIRR